MEKKLHIMNRKRAALLALTLLMLIPCLFAATDINRVIIIGQITDFNSGNPLENQTIVIESENSSIRSHYYLSTIQTNKEGVFVDTIFTSLKHGSFVVFTRDIHGNKIDSIIHFRFLKSATINVFVVDFEINNPQPSPGLQARFKYVQKAQGDRFRFKFLDLTNNNNTKKWHWDFGDGNFSNLQNPEYVYQKPGLYKVQLTIQTAADRGNETSSISKMIYISDILYSHIGGHCFAGYYPIDEGKAYLYLYENENTILSVDTAVIDTLGYYYFYQVPEGKYYVKAKPDKRSPSYSGTIPTYYGDEPYWKKATPLNHAQTNWEYDIRLVEGKTTSAGNGKISGKVSILGGGSRFNESDLAEDVDIYLFDADNNILMSHYTDENHEFDFESLDMGTYWLSPEITGMPMEKVKVDLSNSNPSAENIDFNIKYPEFNIFVQENESGNEMDDVGFPYPNPASNQMTVTIHSETNKQVVVEVLDLKGNTLSSQSVNLFSGQNKTVIPTNLLNRGIYLLCVKLDGYASQKRFVISR